MEKYKHFSAKSKTHIDTVSKYNDLDFGNIIFDDFTKTHNDHYMISKIWYQKSKPISLHVQTSSLKIDDVTKSNNIVLNMENDMCNFFDKLDELALEHTKSTNIIKKCGLKNITYLQIIKESNDNNTGNKNVLKLKIMNNTKFFMIGDKISQLYNDIKKWITNGCYIKTILEIDGIIIDLQRNEIFINIVLRQVLIQKTKPLKIELTEYSFVDSESEKDQNIDINNFVFNTQTEYLDNNTAGQFSLEDCSKTIEHKDNALKQFSSEDSDSEIYKSESDKDSDEESYISDN